MNNPLDHISPSGEKEMQALPRKRGRPKGAKSRRSLIAKETLERMKFCPLEKLIKIAKNPKVSEDRQMAATIAMLPFVFPRLATTHVVAAIKQDVDVHHRIIAGIQQDPILTASLEELYLKSLGYNSEHPTTICLPEGTPNPADSSDR